MNECLFRVCLDAIETLKSYSSKHLNSLQESGVSDGYHLSEACLNLLRTCSEQEDPAKTHQLCETLFECGYVKKGTFAMINEVMSAYVKKYVHLVPFVIVTISNN